MEEWKDIEDFEGLYQVSNLGNVKSLPRRTTSGRILKIYTDVNMYSVIALCKDGKSKNTKVHLIVAKHFVENPENKPFIDHINQDKTDNRAENLRWCSHSENHFNIPKRQGCSSKYKGVTWDKWNNKWKSSVKSNGKTIQVNC